jgi:photosystem II stability/assembly factor-like uncharacterized protein
MATSRGYVVGTRLPDSGIFVQPAKGGWKHIGYNHPYVVAMDYVPSDPSTLYLAAGNGLFRASDHGEKWTLLTSWDVTELRDVAVDRNAPGTIYFAHTAGIRVTHDSGSTWRELAGGLRRHFTEAIRVDRTRAGRVVAGTEDGLFVSENGGAGWRRAGAAGFQVMHIEQSPHDACWWLAVTQQGGLFASHDCGVTFENSGDVGVGRTLSDIAFDPTSRRRVALAGWGTGVTVSEDGGKTWQTRNATLPRPDVWSVAFDPAHSGRLYASVHEESVFVSDSAGRAWRPGGLPGSIVYRFLFVPEAAR